VKVGSRQHGDLHNPIGSDSVPDLRWFYAEPVAPAEEPDDYISGDPFYPVFENDWLNIDSDNVATSFSLAVGGNLKLRLAVTGGEDTPGSTIFTIPEFFRPVKTHRLFTTLGDDSVGLVDVNPDGTVVFVGSGNIIDGGSP
jgi:hypothetical protein